MQFTTYSELHDWFIKKADEYIKVKPKLSSIHIYMPQDDLTPVFKLIVEQIYLLSPGFKSITVKAGELTIALKQTPITFVIKKSEGMYLPETGWFLSPVEPYIKVLTF